MPGQEILKQVQNDKVDRDDRKDEREAVFSNEKKAENSLLYT